MSHNREIHLHQSPEMFSRQALEITFRLLRNNNADLAFALKKTLDHIQFAPSEAVVGSYSGEMHLNTELLKLLQANTIVKIVAAVNDIAQQAVDQKDLPLQQLKILHDLIEDWAELGEWILKHATSEKSAYS